jgi:long-chain acyl-CoA synthetase
MFGEKDAAGIYQWVTYGYVKQRIDDFRSGLASLGIKKGDTVGIIANNRKEWFIGEIATQGLGAAYVPMYLKELTATWKYIIKDAAIKVLIVANQETYEKVKDFPKDIPTLKHIIIIEAQGDLSLAALEAKGNLYFRNYGGSKRSFAFTWKSHK